MRSPALRLVGTLSVCLFALLFTGCGSNNTGKIEGKWRVDSSTAKAEEFNKMKAAGVAMAFEFKADGSFTMLMVPLNDTPLAKLAADAASAELSKKNANGKYTLGMGDSVKMSDLSGKGGKDDTINITINGDSMTMKDNSGTMHLSRVK